MSKQTVQQIVELTPSIADLYQAIYLIYRNHYLTYNLASSHLSDSFIDDDPEYTLKHLTASVYIGEQIQKERNR